MTTNFIGLQSLFLVFMFAASIASGANYNGWTNLAIAGDASDKMRGFWVGWTFFESSLWTVGLPLFTTSSLCVKTPVDDSQYGARNHSDTREWRQP
jgi:hypothetical protein